MFKRPPPPPFFFEPPRIYFYLCSMKNISNSPTKKKGRENRLEKEKDEGNARIVKFIFYDWKKRDSKMSNVKRWLVGSSQFHDSNITFSYCRRVCSMYDSVKAYRRFFVVWFVWDLYFLLTSRFFFLFFFFNLSSHILLCIETLNLYQWTGGGGDPTIEDAWWLQMHAIYRRMKRVIAAIITPVLFWRGLGGRGGQGRKEEAEAEAGAEEGKKNRAAAFPMHYSVAFQTSAYRSCPTSQMRIVELHAFFTPVLLQKLWERSLACFYLFFFFFSVERGMELATWLLARSYVIIIYMPIFSLTYAKHTLEGIETRIHTYKSTRTTHTHTHTHPQRLAQKGRA